MSESSDAGKPLQGRAVGIVGAGPAGLVAAERLAMLGARVTVYERLAAPGRKLLMAGRGGLNLTHSEPIEAFLARYPDAAPALTHAIRAFPPAALLEWVHGLGIETFVGSSGRVFPRAMKASPLLRALLTRLAGLGVVIRTRHRFEGWSDDGGLRFSTPDGPLTTPAPDAVLLALGGASWPRLGSDGRWVELLAARRVAITPLVAANAGVRIAWSETFRARCEGQPLKRIALAIGTTVRRGEAVVTRTGLEGGAVYALGPALRAALSAGPPVTIEVDLMPETGTAELARRLARPRRKQSMATFLRKAAGLAPIAASLLREDRRGALPHDPEALAGRIKAVQLPVDGLAGLERAISTAGGVRFDGLDTHLMLGALPGVFVAGEMLDWDAPTGGYLLQATFATAHAAADGIAAWSTGRPQDRGGPDTDTNDPPAPSPSTGKTDRAID
ncbi:MAG: TIGR03862 family flavoprotein [Pseudomonadota bacterium]